MDPSMGMQGPWGGQDMDPGMGMQGPGAVSPDAMKNGQAINALTKGTSATTQSAQNALNSLTSGGVLADFASELSGYKRQFGQTSDPNQQKNFYNLAQQTRAKAQAKGFDLNELENTALGMVDPKFNPNSLDAGEQRFRNEAFGAVKQAAPYYKDTTPAAVSAPGTNPAPGSQANGFPPTDNPYYSKANELMGQLGSLVNTPFNYDAETDPAFKAAKEINMRNAGVSSRQAMEDMNSRGILNSTVTSENVADVYKQAGDATTSLIPQLMQNAYGQREGQIGNLASLLGTNIGMGNQQEQTAMQQAALTGRWMPSGAQADMSKLLDLKNKAEAPFLTDNQLSGFKSQGDELRNHLATYGINPDLFGSDVSAKDASANVAQAGQLTAPMQQHLLDTILGISGNYFSMPQGTSDMLANLPGGIGSMLAPMLKGLEGQPTRQGLVGMNQMNYRDRMANASEARANAAVSNSGARSTSANASMLNAQNGQTNARSAKATQAIIANIVSLGSADDAYNYLSQHQDALIADGVDIDKVQQAIERNSRWKPKPTPSGGAAAPPNGYQTINTQ